MTRLDVQIIGLCVQMGTKKANGKDARSVRFGARLAIRDRDALRALARARGVTAAEMLRQLVERETEREAAPAIDLSATHHAILARSAKEAGIESGEFLLKLLIADLDEWPHARLMAFGKPVEE